MTRGDNIFHSKLLLLTS